LMGQFGVGELTAVTILAELGDARRFSTSRDAVRYAGLDVTVHQSDRRLSTAIGFSPVAAIGSPHWRT
jgi:transposase